MINLEEYNFQYELYLAESELFNNLINLGASYINESVGLISINEGVKETVENYIEKIINAITNAWDRFKEICLKEIDKVYLKSISNQMQDPKPDFVAKDFVEYDFMKLDQIKLVPFNYEEMKPYLSSEAEFMQHYYSSLAGEGSIGNKIESLVVKNKSDKKVDSNLMKEMYKFCLEFPEKIKPLENDIKNMETSKNNIKTMVSTIRPAETATEAVSIYEVSFEDGQNGPNPEGDSSQGKTEVVKHITCYMKASSNILSAKMKVQKDCYGQYMKCIKHFIKPEKKENKETEENK